MRRSVRLCAAVTIWLLIPLAPQSTSQEPSRLVDTGVIFSAQQLESWAKANRGMGITPPFWTPSPEQIARLEAELRPYLEAVTAPGTIVARQTIVDQLGSYKKQYSGYTKGDKKWIYVNAFCERFWKREDRWRDSDLIIFDGGPCYFQVHYDTSSSQFDRLSINGPLPF
jgi:hypothetical protein